MVDILLILGWHELVELLEVPVNLETLLNSWPLESDQELCQVMLLASSSGSWQCLFNAGSCTFSCHLMWMLFSSFVLIWPQSSNLRYLWHSPSTVTLTEPRWTIPDCSILICISNNETDQHSHIRLLANWLNTIIYLISSSCICLLIT